MLSELKTHLLFRNENNEDEKIKISIVIPTYKRSEYLISAIDSVLSQNDKSINYEIVVVNNDPEDKMEELISRFNYANISFFSNEENYGQVGNMNICVREARGDFISFLHDDDLLLPNYFSTIIKYLNTEQVIDCLITSQYEMFEKYKFDTKRNVAKFFVLYRNIYRRKIRAINNKDCLYALRDIYNPPSCGTVFLKSSLEEFGYFRNEKGAAWDFYNFREFNKNYNIVLLHEYIGIRRCFTGMSNRPDIQEEFRLDMMDLVNENQDNYFIRFFGYDYLNKKGVKYLFARIFRAVYLYSTNLDATKNIPLTVFNEIKGTKNEK